MPKETKERQKIMTLESFPGSVVRWGGKYSVDPVEQQDEVLPGLSPRVGTPGSSQRGLSQ